MEIQHSTVKMNGSNNLSTTTEVWNKIKKTDWNNCSVSFFVGYRKLQTKKQYSIYSVTTTRDSNNLFRDYLIDKIKTNPEFEEYKFMTPVSQTVVLTVSPSKIQNYQSLYNVLNQDKIDVADRYELLTKSDFYIIRYTPNDGGEPFYAFRKMERKYNVKPKLSVEKLLWNGDQLVGVEKKESFQIDKYFDYAVYADTIFIFNQKNFEYILDIREEILNLANKIIENLGNIGIIDNPNDFKSLVGTNLTNLRRVVKIENEGYYQDSAYIQNLLQVIKKKKRWNIKLNDEGNKIIVTADNLSGVVKVLTNNRLTSEINGEEFDIEDKQRVS